jgi:hypothetical protein
MQAIPEPELICCGERVEHHSGCGCGEAMFELQPLSHPTPETGEGELVGRPVKRHASGSPRPAVEPWPADLVELIRLDREGKRPITEVETQRALEALETAQAAHTIAKERIEKALAILNDSSMPTPDRVRFARAALNTVAIQGGSSV